MERKKYGGLVALILAAVMVLGLFAWPALAEEQTTDQIIAQNAKTLYNDEDPYGTMYQKKANVSISANADNVVEAGNNLRYTISYKFFAAESWQNGNEEWIKYFNEYSDNTITLKLPKGLLLNTGGSVSADYTIDPDPTDPTNSNVDIPHTYTFHLNVLNGVQQPIESGSESEGFLRIQIYVANNGTAQSIADYQFDEDMVTLSTTMKIRAEDGSILLDENGDEVSYTHTKTATSGDISTISPDKWIVEKEGVSAVLDGDGSTSNPYTVTFTWDVGVGLTEVTSSETPGTAIDPLTNRYERIGRTQLNTMSLKDVFNSYLNVTTNDVTGQATSVTIQKEIKASTGSSSWSTPETINNNDELVIWALDANGAIDTSALTYPSLVMNSDTLIDINNSGESKEQLTALYTKYRVKVTYPVDESWIAQFPDAAANTLYEHNKATVTPILAGKTNDPSSAEDDLDKELPVAGAGTLNLSKIFKDYKNGEAAYTDTYGPIEYELYITPTTETPTFSVYNSTGGYAKDAEGADMTGKASYHVVVGTTYYLTPGIEYFLKENLTPEQQNVMTQTDVPTIFSKTPSMPNNLNWNVIFHNQEHVGRLTISKVDDAGRPMTDAAQAATFELHDSAGNVVTACDSNGNPITSATTGADGKARFYRLPAGEYTIHEIVVPEGYAGIPEDGVQNKITVSADTEATFTAKNIQNESRVILQKKVGTTQATLSSFTDAGAGMGTFKLQCTTGDPTSSSTVWIDYETIDPASEDEGGANPIDYNNLVTVNGGKIGRAHV